MEEQVLHCLMAAISPHVEMPVRRQAEERLGQLQAEPGFGPTIGQIVIQQSIELPLRQLAAVVLRQYVVTHWDPHAEGFVAPEATPEAKANIRGLLMQALPDTNSRIRSLVAYAVATVAKTDWPDEWGDLFNVLVSGLYAEPHVGDGVMRVLVEFISCVSYEHLPHIVEPLFPEMLKIANDWNRDVRTRSRCIVIFTQLLTMLFEDDGDIKTYLAKSIPHWCELFNNILTAPLDGKAADWGIQTEVVVAITTLLNCNIKGVLHYMPQILQSAWVLVSRDVDRYQKTVVFGSELPEELVDEDGQIMSFENLVVNVFEMLMSCMESKSLRKLVKAKITEVADVALSYMMMTEDQVELWSSDISAFIEDEADETYAFNVRIAAEDLLALLLEEFETVGCGAITSAVHTQLAKGEQFRAGQSEHWWKFYEASMLAIGKCVDIFAAQKAPQNFDMLEFLSNIALTIGWQAEQMFLRGRALWLGGVFAELMPTELTAKYIEASVRGLQTDQPLPVQIGALRALNRLGGKLQPNPEVIRPFIEMILTSLCNIATTASDADVLREVIETLYPLLKIDIPSTVGMEQKLIPLALAALLGYSADPLMAEAVEDIFSAFASIPELGPALQQRALITLTAIVQHHSNPSYMHLSPVCLTIIGKIVQFSPSPLNPALLSQAFPVIARSIATSQDVGFIQNGIETLRMYTSVHFEELSAWRDDSYTAMQYIVQVVDYALRPEMAESACAFIGRLITNIVIKGGASLGAETVNSLLLASLRKIQQAETLTVIQSLLVVFAQLTNAQLEAMVQFLVDHDALEFVLTVWCDNHESFYGAYDTKVSSIALSKLLQSQDTRVLNTIVNGDEIAPPGRRTRSQTKKEAKKFEKIPAAARIFKLLVKEYGCELDKADALEHNDDDDGDEDFEGGWEDFEDDGGKGFSSKKSPFLPADMLLSGMVDLNQEFDEEEEDDPDVKADPLNAINLKEHLEGLFAFLASNQELFGQLTTSLNTIESATLKEAPMFSS